MSPANVVILGQTALGVYALLLAVGGYIGYAKAGSRPSLIAGSASAIVAVVALGLTWLGGFGFWIGLFLAAALTLMFAIRFKKTGKFMPSGMLCAVSVFMIGLMSWALGSLP
jgi:uncharacterized membrane protein (UPF0136 family)